MKKYIVINLVFIFLTVTAYSDEKESCEEKESNTKVERTKKARKADSEFWDLIHGTKNYQNFNKVISKLTKAYNEDPTDVYTIAHIGFANMWAVSEGSRLGVTNNNNTLQYLQNAEQAFKLANSFAPNEPRILGFLGYARLSLGLATQNIDLLRKGQANVNRSVVLWPEWAHFGAAYGPDVYAPFNTPEFKKALAHYWNTLDVCANTTVSRTNPDFISYLAQETLVGRDRACWDSWIAPYNLEGFFLIMGDALVKAGKTEVALIIYNNAKLLKQYDSWPYRKLLESRISNVDLNVKRFREKTLPGQVRDPESGLISATKIPCSICHRGDSDKYFERPKWVGKRANEYLVPF